MTGADAATTTTVLLVRHGETTWNRERRVQGWAPSALTERGKQQARAAGRAIAEGHAVDRIVASDLRRAAETACSAGRAGSTPISSSTPAGASATSDGYRG